MGAGHKGGRHEDRLKPKSAQRGAFGEQAIESLSCVADSSIKPALTFAIASGNPPASTIAFLESASAVLRFFGSLQLLISGSDFRLKLRKAGAARRRIVEQLLAIHFQRAPRRFGVGSRRVALHGYLFAVLRTGRRLIAVDDAPVGQHRFVKSLCGDGRGRSNAEQ